jgi:hypothetical protein
MGNFAFFSTELGPMLGSFDEYDELEELVILDRDPIATGSYNDHAGSVVRGSVISTLGGVVIQDFGVNVQDQRISFSDEAALTETTKEALRALYEISSGTYYFTDGYDCWLVQFSRPNGFVYRRNLISSHYGVARFDYEINLVVKAHEDV